MSLMTVAQVAEFLGVQDVRVERLERESLLIAADKDAAGNPLFDKDAVEKYKVLAERLGGI
ncbi:helix-turn-helix domain-containing protein [Paraglaciecola aquimarina]|uniref:Helix-turn-helix domain-containing protein n=1 Tax=Paraglaciecola algarum TaxID=3050085 RepID=A0ABS9D3E5_9ALTE|nr:helix-turn-helix domain-containing protein [Paraglaciecola sp. G1-23]MCF2947444.1 helix-turn-helix domain-containing protein [Paraglaciecola sp. G1-23]